MNIYYRQRINLIVTLAIIVFTLYVVHRFIVPLAWAAIIAIATFPFFQHWRKLFGKARGLAAFSLTLLIFILIAIPLSWLVKLLVKEIQLFINFLIVAHQVGQPVPAWVAHTPWAGKYLAHYWEESLGSSGKLSAFLSNLHISLKPTSQFLKQVSLSVANRGITLAFTLLCLFFFYRDGEILHQQINHIGVLCLNERWKLYAHKLPSAMRATVNGTILVGLGVGILMGVSYAFFRIPAPVLLGFITSLLAMIPFGAPIIFILVALFLFIKGSLLSGILMLIWGGIVMFVADHFIKPALIGNATKLHFLAVLFGILGGIETMGLVGLFFGPMIMVLFTTLWQEARSYPIRTIKT